MSPYLICDAVIAVLLALAIFRGGKRGFILSLCSLAAVFVAFGGAMWAANGLSPRVEEVLEPRIETAITEKLNQQLESSLGTDAYDVSGDSEVSTDQALNALKSSSLYRFAAEKAEDALASTSQTTIHSIASAVATAVVTAVVRPLIFIAAFFLILLLWTIFSHFLNLADHLPVLHGLNHFLGGIVGLATGILLITLGCFLLRFFGFFDDSQALGQTYLFRFFCSLPGKISLL